MNFTPKTEDQLARERLLSAGEYPFSIMEAQDTTSKAGNDMIKVKLRIFADDGSERHVYDYLLESMGEKLLAFCKSVGLEDEYMTGSLRADMCDGREGFVKLEIEPASKGFNSKNSVATYVPRGSETKPAPPSDASRLKKPTTGLTFAEDDGEPIPF